MLKIVAHLLNGQEQEVEAKVDLGPEPYMQFGQNLDGPISFYSHEDRKTMSKSVPNRVKVILKSFLLLTLIPFPNVIGMERKLLCYKHHLIHFLSS